MTENSNHTASPLLRRLRNYIPTLRLLFRRRLVLIGTIIILVFIFLAIFGPWLAPHDPYELEFGKTLQTPDGEHLLGTDSLGRDVLSRLIYGARTSLIIGIVAVGGASVIGMTLGMIAGFYGGLVNTVIMRIMDAFLAFPMLVLALFITGFLGKGVVFVTIALLVGLIPSYARLMCGQALTVKENDYILAARAMGLGRIKIMLSHMFPNCMPPLIVQMAMMLGATILAEAGLSFLRVGITPPTIAWGHMIAQGQEYLATHPWLSFAPGLAIMAVVFGFNMVGDGLRDVLDPRLRGLL